MSVPVLEIPKNTPALGPKSIHYVESEFQHLLASYSPGKIINSGRVGITRKVLQTLRLLIEIGVSRPVVVVYDHRTVLGTVLVAVGYDKILVAEDGLHTLLIDEYGSRHLYRNCHRLKSHLMRRFENQILAMRRYNSLHHVLEAFRATCEPSLVSDVEQPVFVDQPLIDLFGDRESLTRGLLRKYPGLLVAVHPRSAMSTYAFLPEEQKIKLGRLQDSLAHHSHFIGVYSTVLLFAGLLGRKATLLDINSFEGTRYIDVAERNYASDCQRVIQKYLHQTRLVDKHGKA